MMLRRSPRESASKDSRLSLFSWLPLVTILAMFQIIVLMNGDLFRATGARSLAHLTSEETNYGGYPQIIDATFSSVKTRASKIRPKVDPFVIDNFYRKLHHEIDSITPDERCAAFGVQPHNETVPRRIFYGSMLADENMEILEMNAIEAHGIYHVMAFVESNTTHMATPRKLRFRDSPEGDLLQHSNMFGSQTRVVIDYWLEDYPSLHSMNREVEQRNTITKIWIEAGMTERDIAIMADLDEVVSRDFLRALQVCDFPQLRFQEDEQPSCQAPKMVLSTIQFESSPFCIRKREWFHPDVMLGQCIEGIGDPTERVVPLRNFERKLGERSQKYGAHDHNKYPQHILESGKFPLWSGRDIRTVSGSSGPLMAYKDKSGHRNTSALGVAYHFHNWFQNADDIRHKYATYGHGWPQALTMHLSDIEHDLDLLVRCARSLSNDMNPSGYPYYEHNGDVETFWTTFGGPKPLYFRNDTYVRERHTWLQRIVAADEKKFGSKYH